MRKFRLITVYRSIEIHIQCGRAATLFDEIQEYRSIVFGVFNGERREKNCRQHWRSRLAHGNASFGGEEQEGAEATAAASAGF